MTIKALSIRLNLVVVQQRNCNTENLAELGIAEAQHHGEVEIYWMPGSSKNTQFHTEFGFDKEKIDYMVALQSLTN